MTLMTGFMNKAGTIRVVVTEVTEISNALKAMHSFSYPVTNAMSRLVTGSLLLSSNLKGNDAMGAYLDCSGSVEGLRCETNTLGHLKAYAVVPDAGVDEFDSSYVTDLDNLLISGRLTVTKVIEGGKTPFSGSIEFQGGDIATVFSRYLLNSEQVHSAVMISNIMNPDGTLKHGGGILIQAMPGASEDELLDVEKRVKAMIPFSEVLKRSKSNQEIFKFIFEDEDYSQIFERDISLKCSCSKEKVVNVIRSLSEEDKKQILNEDGIYTVNCHYCTQEYRISQSEIV